MTEVSVIVPFFNAARSLERCLEGLLQREAPAGGYEAIALGNAGRLGVLRETVRSNHLSAAETTLLVVLLALGIGFYNLGWLSVLSRSASPRPAAAPDPRGAQR